jgi:hypothetical protein
VAVRAQDRADQGSGEGRRRKRDTSVVGPFAEAFDLVSSEYGWSDEQILDTPLCRLVQISSAISQRKDDEFYVRTRVIEWHARAVSVVVASGISEDALAGAKALRFFPEDEVDDIPRDATGAPEAVRVGGGYDPSREGASEAPETVQRQYAPDPEPVRAGSGTRVVSESDVAGGVRIADAEVVEQMFGLPSLSVVIRPDNEEG